MSSSGPTTVVKVGGSLLDLPGLPRRLAEWLESELPTETALIIGGGPTADVVRSFDATHGLGDVTGHWMAVRAMALNTAMISSLMPGLELADSAQMVHGAFSRGRSVLIEPLNWLQTDEREGRGVPHQWEFTSDSIAAHVAHRLSADRLILAKSALPESHGVQTAVDDGILDPCFPDAARGLPVVELVNFRADELVFHRVEGLD
ncbi:MAG: hypothetical protein R3336_05270 [Phycisphaeraceae bacterium]|nr:hypothetical protein [Phycisphaeraceae bacterium]